MKEILNFIQVSDSIATSGQPSIFQFTDIAAEGYEVVINLAMHNSDNALSNEDFIVSSLGMSYMHIPITWEKPEEDKLELFLQTLKTLEAQNKKTYIHCAMNYRVSVFMHIYKKSILGQNDIEFIAPNDYEPDNVWSNLLSKY